MIHQQIFTTIQTCAYKKSLDRGLFHQNGNILQLCINVMQSSKFLKKYTNIEIKYYLNQTFTQTVRCKSKYVFGTTRLFFFFKIHRLEK